MLHLSSDFVTKNTVKGGCSPQNKIILRKRRNQVSKAGANFRDWPTIWIADAHRDDGKRFVVHADEKLTAFIELESAVGAAERSEDCGARKITLDNCCGSSKSLLDFVIRQFQLIFGTAA